MGGRGTFAVGKPADFAYKTVGFIEGVKVLVGINGKHSLPESSHSSNAYIKLNTDGTFREMRFYNENHALRLEIAYHIETKLAKGRKKVLHYHVYGENFSLGKDTPFERSTHFLHKNSRLYKRYKKFFTGVIL